MQKRKRGHETLAYLWLVNEIADAILHSVTLEGKELSFGHVEVEEPARQRSEV